MLVGVKNDPGNDQVRFFLGLGFSGLIQIGNAHEPITDQQPAAKAPGMYGCGQFRLLTHGSTRPGAWVRKV
jgi:hypothetical protein